jgi:hypothetical protein
MVEREPREILGGQPVKTVVTAMMGIIHGQPIDKPYFGVYRAQRFF